MMINYHKRNDKKNLNDINYMYIY